MYPEEAPRVEYMLDHLRVIKCNHSYAGGLKCFQLQREGGVTITTPLVLHVLKGTPENFQF